MSYGLYPELFGQTEKDIEHGLYDQAFDRLHTIKKRSISKNHKIFADILTGDIHSYQGKFSDALALQRDILKKLPKDLPLEEAAFHSHAYTLGYVGEHSKSGRFFIKAHKRAKKLHDTSRYYASIIGSIDIEFHDYDCNRFYPPDNKSLLKKIDAALNEIETMEDLQKKNFYRGMFSFRKAIVLWLNGNYVEAKPLFEVTRRFSGTFFRTWALFGIVYCTHKLGELNELQKYTRELKEAEAKPAWKKNAMKYWPVALLLGRTWEMLNDADKAHGFYRTILLAVRDKYTEQSIENTSYSTEYFYPVYQETTKYFITVSGDYRYALNRAEMFRARFLTEEYKRHYGKKRTDAMLTPNIRIAAIGKQLSGVFDNDVTILYCFDFKDSAIILLSKDLEGKYDRITINHKDYKALQQLTSSKKCTKSILGKTSNILRSALDLIRSKRLIVIPHGIFNSVPFHSLLRKNEPLIKDTLVNYWPSLQMAALGESGERYICGSALFIGTKNDPASEEEIKALAGIAVKARQLYDPRLPALTKALQSDTGITHFVTHGKVQDTKQDLTIIKFGWGGIKLSDITAELSDISPVVVLNVCYGGHMVHDAVEFLKGLPVNLFQKGALALIVSSCEVAQETSLLFYKRFYRNFFDGMTLGEAYRMAILDANDIDTMLANAPRIMGTCDIIVNRR
ncbi:MAG: CHAT domain-containing protein [Pseudomonadota bacterium]